MLMSPQELLVRGRVLLVEHDNERAVPITQALSGDGHDVRRARSGTEALMLAAHLRPEVVLLSCALPDVPAMDLCRILRTDHRSADARIFLLGDGQPSVEIALESLESGADDYLAPDVSSAELTARVQAVLRRDRSLRESSPLTGMPGNARVTAVLQRCIEEDTPFALVHADLRSFKAFNDRYGFGRGDIALLTLARVMGEVGAAVGGNPALFGHLGGDDFALLCPPQTVAVVCDEVADRFDEAVPQLYDAEDWERGFIEVTNRQGERAQFPPLTVAMGVATSARRRFGSAAEAAAVATEMKQVAKLAGHSAWRIDQRVA